MCTRCQTNKVAWTAPRVDYCYSCLPGGPFTPPPCIKCGRPDGYFSQGMCGHCHPGSPQHPDSCKGCLAWGVVRRYNWTCWPCRWWRTHYPEGVCDYCGQLARIGEQRACRLCLEQARMLQEPGRALDLAGANKHGQQLFLANMSFKRRRTPRLKPQRADPWKRRDKNSLPVRPGTGFDDSAGVQLMLFEMAPDPDVVRQRVLIEDSDLTRYCAAITGEHAQRYGWSVRQRNDVIRSLRLLQTLRPTPTAKIRASDVLQLSRYAGNIISTIDVLAAAGLLIEDRPTQLENYFNTKTSKLPPIMRQQLEVWLQIMTKGATTAPRQRARDPQTVRLHIMGIAPIVAAWAEAGHQSLAEITPEQVRKSLPEKGAHRHFAAVGLKSLFKTLKARRLVFADPTRGMKASPVATNVPLSLNTAAIRGELNSANPVIALAVALVAFHALTGKRVRELRLTDIVDGRMVIGERTIPLAAPVRTRLAAWLDHRNRTWPGSANPHLLINRRTAPRLLPVSPTFPWRHTTLRPQSLREDRILSEIHATGGDIRSICDLFGLSVEGATRYLRAVEHPDLTTPADWVPRT
jgi:hypothetical protein